MTISYEATPGLRYASIWLENRRGGSAIGIGESQPRLSWLHDSASSTVELELEHPDGERHVRSIEAPATQPVDWPFEPLSSRQKCRLRVRQLHADGTESFSEVLDIETGLLDRSDWAVSFICPSASERQNGPRPAFQLRAEFDLAALGITVSEIDRARIYSTAHGIYEIEINGELACDDILAPGWTSYRHRITYQTIDITEKIKPGINAVGVWLADGWYRGHIGFDGGVWDAYGSDVSILFQLEITRLDGEVVLVVLDDSWRCQISPIISVGLYEGETFDAGKFEQGWSSPGYDDDDWERPARFELNQFAANIEAPTGPPVRVIEALAPVSCERLPSGRIRLDFGQNISGRLRIRVDGLAGHELKLHHAEVLEDGLLGVRPLRSATSVDTYICSGKGFDTWSPRFTIHGFRFAELENWPGGVEDIDAQALVIHSDLIRTGWFESSHAGLNKLHQNVVWSTRDNFVSLPTDCPQRDERAGWTADIQVFAPTALFLFGVHGTLTGWLRDLTAEQADHGHVPNFVPWIECGFPDVPIAGWGDAAVIVPWEMYRHDGDSRILLAQYNSMKAWVDHVDRLTSGTGLWGTGFQLGDWLDPAAPSDNPGDSLTDPYLIATAYHVKTSRTLARVARILKQGEDEQKYLAIADRAQLAFQAYFLAEDGRVINDTVTSIAISLVFDLFPNSDQARQAGRRLIELVSASNFHISTGFIGTPLVCDALVLAGDVDSAYRLLLQEELPSWLYPISMGATTIWERWDSMLPDGTINPGGMTSFNHYALGAIADFLHRVVAGLSIDDVGFRSIRIAPQPGGGLTHAQAEHQSPLGTVSASWTRSGPIFTLETLVPPGASAQIVLPGSGGRSENVGPGRHRHTTRFRPPEDDPTGPPRALDPH